MLCVSYRLRFSKRFIEIPQVIESMQAIEATQVLGAIQVVEDMQVIDVLGNRGKQDHTGDIVATKFI